MKTLGDWLQIQPDGLYIIPADAWIDPSRQKPLALITHGHADHARGGHARVLATPETLGIMKSRFGPQPGGEAVACGVTYQLGEVAISFHPAGHVLGSAQIRLAYRDEVVVVSGDYKRRADPTCARFELVPCDVFITEATFGLPVFIHPPTHEEINKLIQAVTQNPTRCVLVGAYALGKAQRIIGELRAAGFHQPIYLYGAMVALCALYQDYGVDLGELRPVAGTASDDLTGHIIVAPPSALKDRWSRRLPDPMTAMASGWMRIKQRAKQKNVMLPLIISDHADWSELTQTILELRPKEVWVTHGREDALLHWCTLQQIKARALSLLGREDEDD